MTINRMLKFALPAMLLAVNAQAYADDATESNAVRLDNGNSISWSAFTGAISDHSTIKSDPEKELDPNSDALENLKSANTALTNANTALTEAQKKQTAAQEKADETKAPTAEDVSEANNKLEAAKTTQTEKSEELEKAKASLTTAQNAYIKGFQDQLDNANDSLTKKNADLQDLKEQQTELKNQISAQEGYLKQAQATLKQLQNSTTLAKSDSTVTQTAPWLLTLSQTVTAFQVAYDTEKTTPEIWYTYTSGRGVNKNLYLCFESAAPSWKPTPKEGAGDPENWKKINPDNFYNTFVDPSGSLYGITIASVTVYMGSDYAKANDGDATYKIPTVDSETKKDLIVDRIERAISALKSETRFNSTVTITTDKYKDPTAAAQTLKDIDDTEKEIAGYQQTITELTRQLKGYHSNSADWVAGSIEIVGVEEKIATVNTALNTLNGSADTKGSIKYFQAAVETAKTAVENDTATSDAITAAKAAIRAAQTAYNDAVQGVTDAQKAVDDLADQQTAYETAQSELTAANEAAEAAQKTADTAQANYNRYKSIAQAASDDLVYTKYYKDVTLTSNISATPTGTNYDGTIIGNGHIITVTSGDLFRTFSGTLTKTAINGSFAGNVTGSFRDVVRWNGTSGRYYNESGDLTNFSNNNPFGRLGYALRDDEFFGVNFQTGEIVAKKAAPSLVYDITVNDFNNGDEANTQYYAQVIDDVLIASNNTSVPFPVNRFAKSQDELDFPNVYYGANNYCSEVVIVDGKEENFYCPVDITTKSINLNRTLTKGYNTVCLPFALSYDLINNKDILAICNYEKESPERFWFTKVAEGLQANTPLLVVTDKETTLNLQTLSRTVTIAKTDQTQISQGSIGEEGSMSFGTFKKTAAGEFLGQSNMACIYGLNSKGQFQRATANTDLTANQAHFPAFRMVLASNSTFASNSPMRAPGEGDDVKGIGILDGDGNDITDNINSGIEYVGADNSYATSLEVIPGQGMITINSEADYGDVAVYSVDGKVAAIANVMAGTTTVNLQHGVYIVLGKKVMVK